MIMKICMRIAIPSDPNPNYNSDEMTFNQVERVSQKLDHEI